MRSPTAATALREPIPTPQGRGPVRRGGVPGNTSAFSNNPDSPAATGGGSLGYNQNLWNW